MIAYIISKYKNKSTISLDFLFCFGPLEPRLDSGLEIVWKKYQVFTPIAEKMLDEAAAAKLANGDTDTVYGILGDN